MKRTPEYEFSVGLRLTHWIRAICIVVLVVTGFYISYVFIAPSVSSEPNLFLQAKWRFVHLVTGFVLIAATIFKSYLFLFVVIKKVDCYSSISFEETSAI